jgi:tetratricopeptide (TPR) repeat protein
MSYLQRQYRSLLVSILALSAAACFPSKPARVAAVAFTVEDVARAAAKQSDSAVVRAGTPAYLMLLDGLIETSPDNARLLVAGCQAYSTYASLFPAEADQARAGALYARAREYGFRALSTRADVRAALSGTLIEFSLMLQRFGKDDVPALFCTASSWARWTASDLDNLEALAELPLLEATMERVLELDESYSYGSPHLLLGIYLAAKPAVLGGDLAKAKEHFDRALALADGKFLPAKVLYAKYYVRRIQDRELFIRTLEEVLIAPSNTVPELTLSNAVAKEQAKELLEKTDEYFGEQP